MEKDIQSQEFQKEEKLKEYENMFRILYKQRDYDKIKSLGEELLQFDPGNVSAQAWMAKAERKKAGKSWFSGFWAKFKHSPQKNGDEALNKEAPMSETLSPPASIPQSLNSATSGQAKEVSTFNLLKFSKIFMNFTVLFIFLTGGFLYVDYLDEQNRFLGLMGVNDSTAIQLHAAAEKVSDLKKQEKDLQKEINTYKSGYQDKNIALINEIKAQRIHWSDIFLKIKEVTNSVYELNDFFKYVEYDNYAFDSQNQTIQITGRLKDPQGNNLTKLVELEEAFMYYPKDKKNPNDSTKPYFQGFKELTSLSKSIDPETGQYVSDFQLTFSLPTANKENK